MFKLTGPSLFISKKYFSIESKWFLCLLVIYLIEVIHNELIVKPTESIILRDQNKPFIALCTGEGNTRVGLYFRFFVSIQYDLFFL